MLVYVDDIIIIRSNTPSIFKVIFDMQATFALKDLSELNYFLGI